MKSFKNITFKITPIVTKQLSSMMVNPPLMEIIKVIMF